MSRIKKTPKLHIRHYSDIYYGSELNIKLMCDSFPAKIREKLKHYKIIPTVLKLVQFTYSYQ